MKEGSVATSKGSLSVKYGIYNSKDHLWHRSVLHCKDFSITDKKSLYSKEEAVR